MFDTHSLRGRFGVITGAASGIARAAALELANMGAGLALTDINAEGLSDTGQHVVETGAPKPLLFPGDAADPDEAARVMSEVESAFGTIDFLVNSAAIVRRTQFLDMTVEEWDLVLSVNLRGPFLYCREAARRMAARGAGTIVNVASLAGRSTSILGGAHYTVSKHGLIGLSRHMARELAPRGVRVNAFCPGATLTPFIRNITPEAELEQLAAAIPRRKIATPEEQAKVIAFLVTDDSININGACIDSNGGGLMI